MSDRRLLLAGLAVAALVLAGSGVAVAATTTTAVACTSDGTTLSCPIPQTTVTVRATVTATKTATVTATVTSTVPAPTTTVTSAPTTPPTTTATTATSAAPAAAGAYPNATNTGVPASVTLTPYPSTVNSSGDCVLQTANQVIDGQTLNCNVVPRASGIVIKNSKINGVVALDTDLSGSNGWSITLQDTEVAAGVVQLAAVCCGNSTIVRSNIHGGQTGVQCEEKSVSCVVRDSWLHGQELPATANWHLGGFLSDGGQNMTLVHNTVVCDHPVNPLNEGCTGDINFIPNFAPISGALVQDNLFGANPDAAFCTYGGEKPSSPFPHSDHIVYLDNVFQRGGNGKCAGYGAVNAFNVAGPGNVWSGNVWDDGTTVAAVN